MRRRAALEHVIAGISTRLIDAKPNELEAHIERALAELAELVNADRAYLVMPGSLSRIYRWCSQGTSFPSRLAGSGAGSGGPARRDHARHHSYPEPGPAAAGREQRHPYRERSARLGVRFEAVQTAALPSSASTYCGPA